MFVQERLLSQRAKERGWWNLECVRTMLDVHRKGLGREFGGLFWRLLMLDAWARHYVDDNDATGSAVNTISLNNAKRVSGKGV
jgi:asparagine synthase (glutamine-hydrolysing)